MVTTLSYGDAVSNDAIAIKNVLESMGFRTQIYAENIDSRLKKGTASIIEKMPTLKKDDVIIYHKAYGTELSFRLPEYPCRKILRYHNITPPRFFNEYSPATVWGTSYGLDGVEYLADKVDYCLAVSEFNKQDLLNMGYKCKIDVLPILIPFRDYDKTPSSRVIQKYNDDYINILFTGRISPNKKQEDIIKAFYYYNKYINPKSRLFLVGNFNGMEKYYDRLNRYVEALRLTNSVHFTGHIKFDEILAYYKTADLFLCMSEHEGFGVPLAEAMYFNIPIVAYAAAAVPSTLGGSGVLLEKKDPKLTAEVMNVVLCDRTLREKIIEGQKKRLKDFQYENIKAELENYIKEFLHA